MLITTLTLLLFCIAASGLVAGYKVWKLYQDSLHTQRETLRQHYLNYLLRRADLLWDNWLTKEAIIALVISLKQLSIALGVAQQYRLADPTLAEILQFITRTSEGLDNYLDFLHDWQIDNQAQVFLLPKLRADKLLLVSSREICLRYQAWLINQSHSQNEASEELRQSTDQARSHLDARDWLDMN